VKTGTTGVSPVGLVDRRNACPTDHRHFDKVSINRMPVPPNNRAGDGPPTVKSSSGILAASTSCVCGHGLVPRLCLFTEWLLRQGYGAQQGQGVIQVGFAVVEVAGGEGHSRRPEQLTDSLGSLGVFSR